jgi:osmoprotectant transport system ATP-binding protein
VSAILELRGVSKRFGDAVALEPTSVAFASGKTTALIGPSGCGKSTLLRIIIGLITPDEGEVVFEGERIDLTNIARLRHRTGYVIQDGGLFPHLSARDNILVLAHFLKRDSSKMQQRIEELAALTRFPSELLNRFPIELSGGQRQRVSLMRALALKPELLLLDEPLGALDPLVRSALQRDLKEIFCALKQTAILVTHDLAEAAFVADEIILMNRGRIVQRGTLAEMQRAPANPFVSDFINAQRQLVLQ